MLSLSTLVLKVPCCMVYAASCHSHWRFHLDVMGFANSLIWYLSHTHTQIHTHTQRRMYPNTYKCILTQQLCAHSSYPYDIIKWLAIVTLLNQWYQKFTILQRSTMSSLIKNYPLAEVAYLLIWFKLWGSWLNDINVQSITETTLQWVLKGWYSPTFKTILKTPYPLLY